MQPTNVLSASPAERVSVFVSRGRMEAEQQLQEEEAVPLPGSSGLGAEVRISSVDRPHSP